MERRQFFARAAAGVGLPAALAGTALVTGLATPAEAGFTELDLQAQLSSMGTINLPPTRS